MIFEDVILLIFLYEYLKAEVYSATLISMKIEKPLEDLPFNFWPIIAIGVDGKSLMNSQDEIIFLVTKLIFITK